MNLELWHDTTRSRFRQNVSDEENKKFNQELWQILQSNGFNPQEPLSATTFANWRKSLIEKSDAVEKAQTGDGTNLLILRIFPGQQTYGRERPHPIAIQATL